jgi:hypothetical protein
VTRARGTLAVVLFVVTLVTASASVEAQVLFASRPRSGLVVTPLFVVANLTSDAVDVPVEVMFSLMIPSDRSALEFEQDLYLLWPREVIGTEATGGIDLPPVVAAQVSVIGRGRVRLQAQRHYESPADTVVVPTGAPFVSAVRTGGPMGRSLAATTFASRGTGTWPTRPGS